MSRENVVMARSKKSARQMTDAFQPPLGFEGQSLVLLIVAFWAFVLVVAFFLYENMTKRSLGVELVMAVISGFTLGTAIFFGLLRADVIL